MPTKKSLPPFLKGKAGAAADAADALSDDPRPFIGKRKGTGESVTPPTFAVHVHVHAPEPLKRKLATKRKEK